MQWHHWHVDTDRLEQLLRRTELLRPLLRRSLEEEITQLVELPAEQHQALEQEFRQAQGLEQEEALSAWLEQRGWNPEDLELHLARPVALNLYAQQRFGPGVEDTFLQRKNDLDTVVYSLLRVGDQGLARELWIQLSEGEISFAEAASRHSDGPEATTKGVIGPLTLGQIQPELAERLRSLRQGDLRAPEQMGPWWVLLRLEQLTPARLDGAMRDRLLQEQLNTWLEERTNAVIAGEHTDPLHYDR
jgi:parvulin-like peptidyl-prolyl isomerase